LILKSLKSGISEQDLSFITSDDPRHYAEYLVKDINENNCESKGGLDKLKGISYPIIKLLQSMIEFNPYFRPCASEALYSEIFESIRD